VCLCVCVCVHVCATVCASQAQQRIDELELLHESLGTVQKQQAIQCRTEPLAVWYPFGTLITVISTLIRVISTLIAITSTLITNKCRTQPLAVWLPFQ
jgi:hypothetical protein